MIVILVGNFTSDQTRIQGLLRISSAAGCLFPWAVCIETVGDCTITCILSWWWRHQMETFSAFLALCVENSPVTGEFPHKGQWRGALLFSLICAWIIRLSKQSIRWWFETPSGSLWCHCNDMQRSCFSRASRWESPQKGTKRAISVESVNIKT